MPETISKSKISRCENKLESPNVRSRKQLLYLGSYFNRNPQQFYINLSVSKQNELIDRLQLDYSQILFDYFSSEDAIARLIDRFVTEVFLVNLPVHKIVEIHCSLIDDLRQQFMLEGIQTAYLGNFRLTLIEIIARLGEMYRKAYVLYK